MKNLIAMCFLIIVCLSSCDNAFDIIVRRSDGVVYKYKCTVGKDTLNSTRYSFYKSSLISQVTYVDGKIDGSMIDYYSNGNINNLRNYIANSANGISKKYNENGTLLGRMVYINGSPILREEIKENTELSVIRKQIINLCNNQRTWAGEMFLNEDGAIISVGSFKNDTSILGSYNGMYVDLIIDDTINFQTETLVHLDITFPTLVYDAEILIGKFDKTLVCTDTLYYSKADSVPDLLSFMYKPVRPGNEFLVGRLAIPDNYVKEDIYFFKGFYVLEN